VKPTNAVVSSLGTKTPTAILMVIPVLLSMIVINQAATLPITPTATILMPMPSPAKPLVSPPIAATGASTTTAMIHNRLAIPALQVLVVTLIIIVSVMRVTVGPTPTTKLSQATHALVVPQLVVPVAGHVVEDQKQARATTTPAPCMITKILVDQVVQ